MKNIFIFVFVMQIASSQNIEGRWVLPMFEGDPGNTMYEFVDGLRYTYYCADDNGCDSTYWNSLDTSDAIPNPDSYTFIYDTLAIDESSGSFVDFECETNYQTIFLTLAYTEKPACCSSF